MQILALVAILPKIVCARTSRIAYEDQNIIEASAIRHLLLLLVLVGSPVLAISEERSLTTTFETDRPGAAVSLNKEYVGKTPVSVDMTNLVGPNWMNGHAKAPYADVEIEVKVLPPVGKSGCSQIERIRQFETIPRRMFFNTQLCPIGNSLDVNVR